MIRGMFILICLFVLTAACAESDEGNGFPDTDTGVDIPSDVDVEMDTDDQLDMPVDIDAEAEIDVPVDVPPDPTGDPDVDVMDVMDVEVEDIVDVPPDDTVSDPDITTLPGDSCANPIVISMSGSTHTENGSSAGMHHDHDGPPACSIPASRLDVVYEVDISAGYNISIEYTSTGTMDCISVQKACPDTSLIGGCTCGDPTTTLQYDRDFDTDGPAYIFVWADGEKDFTLDITITAI